MIHIKLASAAVAIMLLSACSSTGSLSGKGDSDVAPPPSDAASSQALGGGSQVDSVPFAAPVTVDPLNDPSSPLTNRVIYFDYDKSDIRPEFTDVVNLHGRYLADNPALRVRIEGHTDERGTREYNIGLGDRRANAVRNMLMIQGARSGQIQIISYGEEMPSAFTHDESSWRLNRRAEIIYEGR